MKHIPALDSFRALAVLLVIIGHYTPGESAVHVFPFSMIGVVLFFTLSGFLITGILLREKEKISKGEIGRGRSLLNFYLRRVLRIFPIYYALVLFFMLLPDISDSAIKSNYAYYLTYTSNFWMYRHGDFDGILGHLWSLSVEEQFYLIWPFLILAVPMRHLPKLFLSAIMISLAFRTWTFSANGISEVNNVLTPAAFDAFALGGWLSYLILQPPAGLRKYTGIALTAGIAGLTLSIAMPFAPMAASVIDRLSIALIGTGLIGRLLELNSGSLSGKIICHPVMLYIGKISYGLYVYHLVMPWLLELAASLMRSKGWYWPGTSQTIIPFFSDFRLQLSLIVVAVAAFTSASWYWFEKPILSLKRHFQ